MLGPNVFDLFAPCLSINDVFTMYSMSASNDVSHFIPCRPHAEVAMRHVEGSGRRYRHQVQCVVLDIRDPHRFLTVSVQCLLRGDSNCLFLWRRFPWDPSRNVLFSGARLLISDFTWFSLRCDPPSVVWCRRARVSCTVFVCTVSRHRAIVTNVILAPARVASWVGPVLNSLVTSLVPVFWSVHVVTLGCVSDADDPPWETEACGPALCPAQFSSESPTRNDRRHWPPSVFLSLLDPWSRAV